MLSDYSSGSQRVVPRPAALAPPGGLLEIKFSDPTQTHWIKLCRRGTTSPAGDFDKHIWPALDYSIKYSLEFTIEGLHSITPGHLFSLPVPVCALGPLVCGRGPSFSCLLPLFRCLLYLECSPLPSIVCLSNSPPGTAFACCKCWQARFWWWMF